MPSYKDQAVAEEAIEVIPAAAGAQTVSAFTDILPQTSRLSEFGPQPKADQRRVPRFISGRDWPTLVTGTVLAFLLRLFLILRVEGVISPDGVRYLGFARQLASGNFPKDSIRTGRRFIPYW